jgi:chaperonin GroES
MTKDWINPSELSGRNETAFTPLGKNVLVRPDSMVDKTASGLYIPESAQDTPNQGVVLAVSKEIETIVVGDRIMYQKFHQKPIKLSNEELAIVSEEHILGVFK